jgi:hypothetical protein
MKNKLNILVLLLICFAMYRCDDSFLEGQGPNLHQLQDTLFVVNDEVIEDLELRFPMAGNGAYTIVQFPGWMQFKTLEGKFNDGKTVLSYVAKNIAATQQLGVYYGYIEMKIAGYGSLMIPVAYGNFGHPVISTSPSTMAIGDRQSMFFIIKNTSNGILFWQTGPLPAWLELSDDKGIIGPNESVTLIATVNRQAIEIGTYSGRFTIYSNSAERTTLIDVSMEVTRANSVVSQEAIAGEMTDAVYLKDKDIMVLCTKIPNRLLVYDFNHNKKHVIELDKSPACIDFSADGKKAVVGYNLGAVSRIDMVNFRVEKTLNIDCIPHDVVYGENEWCYITPTANQWTKLRNLNLETGELILGKISIYEKTIIKRQVNTNILIGTRLNLSPNGIEIFKINPNYLVNDTVGNLHIDTSNFWLSEDGNRMFCGNGNIYRTPMYPSWNDMNSQDPQLIGRLEAKLERVNWIDHNSLTNSLFVAESSYYLPSVIEQFDASNYNLKREIPVQKYQLNSESYSANVHYIFSNREGNLLFLIKKVSDQYQLSNGWSYETLSVD